ncbi:MAG: YfhO family protein [Bacteroidota bacterium]
MNQLFKQVIPHVAAVVVFLLVAAFYFSPQLEGKVVQKGDIIQFGGMSKEIADYRKETGKETLWTNGMFGGMPTYQIGSIRKGNLLHGLFQAAQLWIPRPIGMFFAAMLCFYILLIVLKVNPWLSIVGAIAFAFSTNNFVLYEAGHMSKLNTTFFLPLMTAGIILAFREKYIWGFILFGVGAGIAIVSNHPQMTYIYVITLIIFGIAQLIYSIRNNKLIEFGKAAGVLIVAGLLALGASFTNLWVTFEYTQDTIRGNPILASESKSAKEVSSSSETEGLAWDYAMGWSNGTVDLMSTLIPGAAGGSGGEALPSNSALRKALAARGQRLPDNFLAPLYWGKLPFTSGPNYFGAGMFLLFILGLFVVKGPIKWWLGLGALLTAMLSLGKNLEGFNTFIFEYLPLYDKFRSPNSVLTVTAIMIPLLGMLAVYELMKEGIDKKKATNYLYIATGILSAVCLYFVVLGPSSYDFMNPSDPNYAQMGFDIDALMEDRKTYMVNDALRSLAFILVTAGLLWAFLKEYIKPTFLIAGLALITLADLYPVGRRYLNEDKFVTKNRYEQNYTIRPVDQQILQDTDPHYRVQDLTSREGPFSYSFASYFHKTIGGYHAAKLQRYQDIIDRHLARNNQEVYDMLNTKYFIVPGQNNQPMVQSNPNALGNAWFVSSYKMVDSPNAEIDALNDFDAGEEAIVNNEFSGYVNGLNLNKNGSISLTSYAPNAISYQSNSTSEQLAVFSEVWYGPNKGWQAYIDGEKVEHIRANYVLRALKVPAGQHNIEFRFDPQVYYTGTTISLICSGILLLGFLGYGGYNLYNYYQNMPVEAPKPKPQPTKKPVQKTQSTRTANKRNTNKGGKKKRK